ncbi:MAG: penicillin-binding protein activator [Rhodospirillaceae bacterium]|nr:MAG: penicillin-binding protein activator [Rhodospirillaceae bacterium]
MTFLTPDHHRSIRVRSAATLGRAAAGAVATYVHEGTKMWSRGLRWMIAIRTIVAAAVVGVALASCAASTSPSSIAGAPLRTTVPAAKSAPSPVPVNQALIPAPAAPSPVAPTIGLARVAILLPLTGPSAPIGEALLDAAEMALFDAGDEHLILQVYNTGGTPEETAKVAAKAIADGAQIILGPVFAADAKAASPVAMANGVNIVTFSTDPTIAGGNVFELGFLVQEQVREIVTFARSQGHTRFAVLAPESAYGQAAVDAFRTIVPAQGGQISRVGVYAADGSNLEDVVKEITNFEQRKRALAAEKARLAGKTDDASQQALKNLAQQDTFGDVDFDAILLPDQGTRLTRAATLLPYYDVDPNRVQLLGTLLWNTPNLGQEPAMVGGMYPSPSPEGNQKFMSRYRDLYGHPPPTIASHGYDAVALAAALARSGIARPFAAESLTSPSGFAGVDGIFRFLPNGLSERSFAVMQVTHDGPVLVQAGASTFTGAGF